MKLLNRFLFPSTASGFPEQSDVGKRMNGGAGMVWGRGGAGWGAVIPFSVWLFVGLAIPCEGEAFLNSNQVGCRTDGVGVGDWNHFTFDKSQVKRCYLQNLTPSARHTCQLTTASHDHFAYVTSSGTSSPLRFPRFSPDPFLVSRLALSHLIVWMRQLGQAAACGNNFPWKCFDAQLVLCICELVINTSMLLSLETFADAWLVCCMSRLTPYVSILMVHQDVCCIPSCLHTSSCF